MLSFFEVIHHIFKKHEGCYGSPKITREMHKLGYAIGQKRVACIMQEHGLKAKNHVSIKTGQGHFVLFENALIEYSI